MFGKMITGESIMHNRYTAMGGPGFITLASSFPGSIIPFEIQPNMPIIVQKSGFLASSATVDLSVHFNKKAGAGFFGGEGFILQKLSGYGTAFVEIEDGVNEHGLAVGLTSVYPNQCKPGFNAGMIVRYLLEKCKNVSEAVSCLYQLPIASAQTLTLADAMGTITVIECNAEQIKVEKTLNNNLSFVCATNTFHFPEMMGYNNDKIDNWFAEERYQTLYSAFNRKNGGFNLPFAEKLLSGDYGFLCQYDRSTGKDTVWSVIYDMKRHKIYRSEGNPGRHKFKEDTRFQF